MILEGLTPSFVDGPFGIDDQSIEVKKEGAEGRQRLHGIGISSGRWAPGVPPLGHEDPAEDEEHHSEQSEKTSEDYGGPGVLRCCRESLPLSRGRSKMPR